MKDKKSFIFYTDWIDTFKALPKDKGYDLLLHILSFVNGENPKTEDLLINAVFQNIKNTLERDLNKFNEIKAKRSEAGKISAKKRANKRQQTPTKPTSVESFKHTITNPTVSDNDSVSDSVNVSGGGGKTSNTPTPPTFEDFISFAKMDYPNIDISQNSQLANRYKTWEANNWCDKNGNSILKYWQSKLMAALPHIYQSTNNTNYPKRKRLNRYGK